METAKFIPILLVFVISIESQNCTDDQNKKLEVCMKNYAIESLQQKPDSFWNACKTFHKCSEAVKCQDMHATNLANTQFCFANVIENNTFSHCLKTVTKLPCWNVITEKISKIIEGVEKDKKKNCQFLKIEARKCFEDGIRGTKGCGEKELKDFGKIFDDLVKTVDC
ncbi:unnamed protein product [Caenorhabditis angaria]|uniref:DUF19 domain-containing protein n=1 Tax=Caenorhabditis angaria TaxID=860376 RepID=A0A9P1IB51_9PELO|nr:unnamed protein product [Caenorhabditis angaria]